MPDADIQERLQKTTTHAIVLDFRFSITQPRIFLLFFAFLAIFCGY